MNSETLLTRRLLLRTLTAACLGSGVSLSHASDAPAWLVASDRGDAYDEAIQVLRAETPGVAWRVFTATGLPAPGPHDTPPRAIVTLGSGAWRALAERVEKDPTLAQVPLLAGLLPRAAFEALSPTRSGPVASAVWLDPAVERYLDLVRRTMPERLRVGVLFGPTSRQLRPAVVKATYDRGLELVEATVQGDDFYPALAQVLREADVLLALPDNAIYHSGTLNNVLIAAYRQRVPVVSYAASHVKAGATMALHVTPAQAGRQLATVLRRSLADRRPLPPPAAANDWSLSVNTQVARSLGIQIGDTEALLAALRRMEGRP